MSPLLSQNAGTDKSAASRAERRAIRTAEKTSRQVDKLLKKWKPEEIALDAEHQLRSIRLEALSRISDDTVLARVLIALITWKPKEKYPDPYDTKTRMKLISAALPRVTSPQAMGMLKQTILDMDFDRLPAEAINEFIRRMNDKDCMLKLHHHLNYIGSTHYMRENIDLLKQLGASRLEIAKETRFDLFSAFVPELIDEEVIRFFANDPRWIQTNRSFIPKDLVIKALERSEHRREALLQYQIVDGVVVKSECEFGRHDFVVEREERDRRDDDQMRFITYTYYRCSRCGQKHKKVDDGWGRVSEFDGGW